MPRCVEQRVTEETRISHSTINGSSYNEKETRMSLGNYSFKYSKVSLVLKPWDFVTNSLVGFVYGYFK